MNLKDILQKLVSDRDPVLLSNGTGEWKAEVLLETLSAGKLKQNAFYQPGLYVAAIDDGGYLGEVLFRIKPATAR